VGSAVLGRSDGVIAYSPTYRQTNFYRCDAIPRPILGTEVRTVAQNDLPKFHDATKPVDDVMEPVGNEGVADDAGADDELDDDELEEEQEPRALSRTH
jgi:hypothetical protein